MRKVLFTGVDVAGVCSCCFGDITSPAARVEGDYPLPDGTEREYRDVLDGLPIEVAPEREPSHGYVLVCRECARAMLRAIEETP